MRITQILNCEQIREYIATALDTTVENTSEYAIVNSYPADFDHYHHTGTPLSHDSFEKIFQFNIIKTVKEKTIIAGIKITTLEALKHWKGKNEAERVNTLKKWLDVHVYNYVETAIYYIQQKEQEITGND